MYNKAMPKRDSCSIGKPFSANDMYAPIGRGMLRKTKRYNNWIKQNVEIIKNEMDKVDFFPTSINVVIIGGRGLNSMTRNDVDNFKKPICDLLVKAGIVPDDEKKYIDSVLIKYLPPVSSRGEPLTRISYDEPEQVEWIDV